MKASTATQVAAAIRNLAPGDAQELLNEAGEIQWLARGLLQRRAGLDASLGVRSPRAGLKIIRRTASGTVVGLYDSRESDNNPDPGSRWRLVCEGPEGLEGVSDPHGGICGWPTRSAAESYLPYSQEWCPVCQDLAQSKGRTT